MKNEIYKNVTGHSRLSPSSSQRWMICPGSIQLSEKLGNQNTSSSYAAEGNAAHNLHEQCLYTGKNADKFLGDIIKIGDHEFIVTPEIASSVQISIDYSVATNMYACTKQQKMKAYLFVSSVTILRK